MNRRLMNIRIRRVNILKTKYSVDSKTVNTVNGVVEVATAGDAKYQDTTRDITDVYNVLVLICMELMFWIMWNVVRTVYRILCDFKKF